MYSFNITILGEGHPLSPGWQGPGRYFNPPSPCGEGPAALGTPAWLPLFQSTLPVWGGTFHGVPSFLIARFQSTLPVWGGTFKVCLACSWFLVSIHPPRVGRDYRPEESKRPWSLFQSTLPVWGGTGPALWGGRVGYSFNPPSPCGEGLAGAKLKETRCQFQSTLPVWGGTCWHT